MAMVWIGDMQTQILVGSLVGQLFTLSNIRSDDLARQRYPELH